MLNEYEQLNARADKVLTCGCPETTPMEWYGIKGGVDGETVRFPDAEIGSCCLLAAARHVRNTHLDIVKSVARAVSENAVALEGLVWSETKYRALSFRVSRTGKPVL